MVASDIVFCLVSVKPVRHQIRFLEILGKKLKLRILVKIEFINIVCQGVQDKLTKLEMRSHLKLSIADPPTGVGARRDAIASNN